MISLIVITLLLFSFYCLPLSGNTADTLVVVKESSWYSRTQYAGNLGLASVGLGKTFFDNRLSIDLNYGYLPEFINGTSVHTLALKPSFYFSRYELAGIKGCLYIGTTANYSITPNTYLKYPDYYPKGYYQSNAFHINPFTGIKFDLLSKKKKITLISPYIELGTVDYKIWYAIKNKSIKHYQIFNICFGIISPIYK